MHLAISAPDIGRHTGGNESYMLGLLAGLAHLPECPELSVLVTQTGARAVTAAQAAGCRIVNVGGYHRVAYYFWQQSRALAQLRPDWYLSTFFRPARAPCRTAVLVHDLSFCVHPEYFPRSVALYMRLLTGLALRRAELLIAPSEFTRREIARFDGRAGARTLILRPGVSHEYTPDPAPGDAGVLVRYGLEPGYILAMGNIHPRKNLARLLTAYLQLASSGSAPPPMLWVGTARWDSARLVQEALAAGVILPGFVPQADLPALYRHAAMLIYPSLYEGFGLPPLEAMACGTPVVVSNTTSLPETVGEAGLLVNPGDPSAIAAAIGELLRRPETRGRLRAAGLARAAEFDWGCTAHNLLNLLAAA